MLNLYDFLQSSLWEKSISLWGVCGSLPTQLVAHWAWPFGVGMNFSGLIFRWGWSVNVFLNGGFCFVSFCFVPLRPLVLLSEELGRKPTMSAEKWSRGRQKTWGRKNFLMFQLLLFMRVVICLRLYPLLMLRWFLQMTHNFSWIVKGVDDSQTQLCYPRRYIKSRIALKMVNIMLTIIPQS